VGKSYNLAKGNPMSKSIDPGFSSDIFEITYDKGQMTEDGKYLVPDGVTRSQVSACSFTSEEKIYRGTQSYREELKSKASFEAGYSGIFLSASFSSSVEYETIRKQTVESKNTIVHATA
jgi:hypothetical protein